MWRESKGAKEIKSVFGECKMEGIRKSIGNKEKNREKDNGSCQGNL